MPRYLKDISIHLAPEQRLPNGYSKKDFNISTHTVQDIFWYLIPKRFEFGNILKLNIEIKGKGETSSQLRNYDGYVHYSYPGFDFGKYFSLTKVEQNQMILEVLKAVLLRVPVEIEENKKTAVDILKKIEDINFKLRVESKLSKYDKRRKLRAVVEIIVNDEGQHAYVHIVNKSKEVVLKEYLLKNEVYEFHKNLYKSRWLGKSFQIIDREGQIFKEFMV